jgi:hypothetical protein
MNAFRWPAALSLALFSLSLQARAAEAQQTPIALHPQNPHYFFWREQPTILITSGEHYGALLNRNFDYYAYFGELQEHGLNHTRVFSGVYREVPGSFGITDNPLAPAAGQYVGPWMRSDQPGNFDGGAKFDLTKWDDSYFARLKDLMQVAAEHGIVVELTLFCPMYNDELWKACPMNAANNVNGIGDCPRTEVYTLKHQDLLDIHLAFTRKVVNELREFDNLYYEVCNEPYFGGVTMEWQHRVIDTIVQTEKDFAHKHLISLNIANGRAKVEDPHPAVSIFNFHYCVPPDTVALNYGLNKVIGENETGFRGKADILYRTEAWDFLLAGGGLFNNLDYSFTPTHSGGTLREYQSPGGGSRELREQLGILKHFLYGFDFVRMKPDSESIRKVSPELRASVLSETGKAYAIYLHVPLPNKPEDPSKHQQSNIEATIALQLPAGTYQTEWLNTKTGEIIRRESFQHSSGEKTLASPPFDDDIALRLVSQ